MRVGLWINCSRARWYFQNFLHDSSYYQKLWTQVYCWAGVNMNIKGSLLLSYKYIQRKVPLPSFRFRKTHRFYSTWDKYPWVKCLSLCFEWLASKYWIPFDAHNTVKFGVCLPVSTSTKFSFQEIGYFKHLKGKFPLSRAIQTHQCHMPYQNFVFTMPPPSGHCHRSICTP